MNTDKPTIDQVITYLTNRLDGMMMPGAVRMTTAARDYLLELQAENEKLRDKLEQKEKYYEQMVDALAATESIKLERVKRERDAAVLDLHGTCSACAHYTPYHNDGPCATCKFEIACFVPEKATDKWEWRGKKRD